MRLWTAITSKTSGSINPPNNYNFPKLIKSGRYKDKWVVGRKSTKVTMFKYYEWECKN